MSFWKTLVATAILGWILILWRNTPDPRPPTEVEPYTPTLAEQNGPWDRRCAEMSCNDLPLGVHTIDIGSNVRLFMPLTATGRPVQTGWARPGNYLTQYGADHAPLRHYDAVSNLRIQCCPETLLDALGISVAYPSMALSRYIRIDSQPQRENFLGWHLYTRLSATSDRILDPTMPPPEFVQEFDHVFWRITHKYNRDGNRINLDNHYLSKRPMIESRHVFLACSGQTYCGISTLANNSVADTHPYVNLEYVNIYASHWAPCAEAGPSETCDKIEQTVAILPDALSVVDAVVKALKRAP